MPRALAFLRPIAKLIVLAGALTAATSAAIFIYLNPKLPDIEVLRDFHLQTPLRIYSRDGLLIGEFGEMRRTPVLYADVPPKLTSAFISAEDDRFYKHHGVDITGLLRAASQLISTGSIQTGGSTITMQVAKNYFLSRERTFSRKFNEILLAIKIEQALSKPEIMELYLNKIFLGNHAYGVQAAAQVYYGKTIDDLNLAQMAMVAGLPKAPSAYNPIANPVRAKARRNWILGRMHNLGYITETEYREAFNAPVTARYHRAPMELEASYVAEMARREMLQRFGLDAYTHGYHVYTTIDSRLQHAANGALIQGLQAYDRRHGYRGAEQRLELPQGTIDQEVLVAQLRNISPVGRWLPAVVTEVHDQAFGAITRNGDSVRVEWSHGLSGARPYLSVDSVGASPSTAADVVRRGDVVRLEYRDEAWHLSQIPEIQGALVSVDADNGAILSLVGGLDQRASAFNRATQAARQPGSNFKPFIYAAALNQGFTPASMINDAPIVFDDDALESAWRPTNESGRFYGPTRLRVALYNSRNLVTVRLLREMGIGNAIRFLDNFGFNTRNMPRDLSLSLGSHATTPMDMNTAYTLFANGGYRVQPYLIDRIDDIDGNEVFRASPPTVCRDCDQLSPEGFADDSDLDEMTSLEDILSKAAELETLAPENPIAERVLDERLVYIMDSMMQDVIRRGTGRQARQLERSDIAGKTGTTNGPTDAWFSGYAGGVVTTAWVGFDNNQVLGRREFGGSLALPIWTEFMREALRERPERPLRQPDGIVSARIDPGTGLLAEPEQSNAIFEIFLQEYAPRERAAEGSRSRNGALSEEATEIF